MVAQKDVVLAMIVGLKRTLLIRMRPDWERIEAMVGGAPVSMLRPPATAREIPDWHAYRHVHTAISSQTFNPLATGLARAGGWRTNMNLHGPIVFLGDGPNGTEADVPYPLIEVGIDLGLWT